MQQKPLQNFLLENIELIMIMVGFDVSKSIRKLEMTKWLWTFSMKERIQLLDGEFAIRSELNRGTRYYIRIPLKVNEVINERKN